MVPPNEGRHESCSLNALSGPIVHFELREADARRGWMTRRVGQRGRTDAMDVYAFVRGEILACRIRPGTRLKIHELCAQHDVSNGAVREALSRLASEGLVLFEP